jgi:hypothetical protein
LIAGRMRELGRILILSGIKCFVGCGQPCGLRGKFLCPYPLAQRGENEK